jgi:P4 family phage/plasmid primase-like protien
MAGKEVFVVHDCDAPGQEGAVRAKPSGNHWRGWAPEIAKHAASVRNVVLPYPIEEKHGKDIRDWIGERLDRNIDPPLIYEELLAYARDDSKCPVIQLAKDVINRIENKDSQARDDSETVSDIEIEEADQDPHRLARVNLRYYTDNHGGQLRFWREEWWRYRDGKYRKIGPQELKAKVAATIKTEFDNRYRERVDRGEEVREVRQVTRGLVSNVIGAMESLTLLSSSIEMPSWVPDRSERHYISMENGILDLDAVFRNDAEHSLISHSPDWFSTVKLEYGFDINAKCDKWENYLDFCMDGDEDCIDLLQEWAGYLLTGSNEYQRFLALEGEGGNGKSVYFAGLTAMLGIPNVSHVAMENFGGRFDLASTIGKAANISGDVGEIDSMAEGILKMFTGGDVMQFDRKNLPPISVRPTAKLMMSFNGRPRIKDRSQGLWRRMLLVPFNRSIPSDRIVRGMDNWRWWLDSGEVPGMLLWAIAGLDRLRSNGEFTKSEKSMAAIENYQIEENSARQFLMDEVDWLDADLLQTEKEKPEAQQCGVDCETLYSLYRQWCIVHGNRAMNNKNFGKEVKRVFGDLRVRVSNGTHRPYFYRLLRPLRTSFHLKQPESNEF